MLLTAEVPPAPARLSHHVVFISKMLCRSSHLAVFFLSAFSETILENILDESLKMQGSPSILPKYFLEKFQVRLCE